MSSGNAPVLNTREALQALGSHLNPLASASAETSPRGSGKGVVAMMLTSFVIAGVTSLVGLLGILVGAKLAHHRCRCGVAHEPEDGHAGLGAHRPRGEAIANIVSLERRDAPPRAFPFPVTTTIN